MMQPTTAQQIHTLLTYLQTKQSPPFDVLFWSNLQKIDFDYSENSIVMLGRFFAAMSKRHIQLADVVSKEGGKAFVVAIAAYLADYLAKTTGQSIDWLNYEEMSLEVARQNAQHRLYLQLVEKFEYSLTAKIGEKVYCQPLKLLPSLLAGEDVLPQFIAEMTQTILQQAQVNLLQEPDDVCRQYLAKVKTGKLLDKSIGFYNYLSDVNFDYSLESLAQIDQALATIQQDFSFNRENYLNFFTDASRQAFCYLLGFYIGVTSSRLANAPVRWVSFEQMYESLGDEFAECLEHSFVLLFEDCYRTPMLVVTNRLFGIAPNFSKSAVEFANILQAQNSGDIQVFPYQPNFENLNTKQDLPLLWQKAMQVAGVMVAGKLLRISQNQPVAPSIYQAKIGETLTVYDITEIQQLESLDTDRVIDSLYATLQQNPQSSPFIVACFDSHVNLPMGRTDGLVIKLRVYDEPHLTLQLVLPYQSANDEHGLIIYPLVSNQDLADEKAQSSFNPMQLDALIQTFYQSVVAENPSDTNITKVWQDAYVDTLDFWALPPKDLASEQKKIGLVDTFDFPVLPIVETDSCNQSSVGSMPTFDYSTINWRGFDLAKHILQTQSEEQTYLQVFASDSLIQDELYRQAEATDNLYRYGKVVWGVVVHCDEPLQKPITEDERDKPFANHLISVADILFDPSGLAPVADLQAKASQLMQVSTQQSTTLNNDIDFYRLHMQDAKSRVFNLPYPKSIASVDYRISSSWIWRRHLPNAMLSNTVVPIIINPKNLGEVMVLPSKLWDKSYYQYWLSLAYQRFAQDYDLLPFINWQQEYGQDNFDTAIQKRLFPKFKNNRNTPVRTEQPVQLAKSQNVKSESFDSTLSGRQQPVTSVPKPAIQTAIQEPVQSALVMPTMVAKPTEDLSKPVATPPISEDLVQQLMNDKLRLQSQLSTQDKEKEKKLIVIFASVIVVIVIAILLSKLMR